MPFECKCCLHNAFTDISTRFLVDQGSELYYDATPLLEVQQQERREESRSRRPSNANPHANHMHAQDLYRSNSYGQPSPHRSSSNQPQPHTPTQNPYPYGGSPTPSRFPSQGGYNSVSPGQFYSGRDMGSVRPGMGIGHDTMGVVGGMGRRVTRGMADDGYHGM
jgi:hypothetical protein